MLDSHKVTKVKYEPFIRDNLVGYKCKVEGLATIDGKTEETYSETYIYLNPSAFDPQDQENSPNIFVYRGMTDNLEDGDPQVFIEPFTH